MTNSLIRQGAIIHKDPTATKKKKTLGCKWQCIMCICNKIFAYFSSVRWFILKVFEVNSFVSIDGTPRDYDEICPWCWIENSFGQTEDQVSYSVTVFWMKELMMLPIKKCNCHFDLVLVVSCHVYWQVGRNKCLLRLTGWSPVLFTLSLPMSLWARLRTSSDPSPISHDKRIS